MSDLKDIIGLAAQGKATDFQAHISDLLSQRAVGAIDARRADMSKFMFNPQAEEAQEAQAEEDDEALLSDEEIQAVWDEEEVTAPEQVDDLDIDEKEED